nr:unnamed protein product [Callosobruchus analis]
MLRKYKRRIGSRSYADYSEEKLETCLKAVRNRVMTQRQASMYIKIPRSTIKNKLTDRFPWKTGHPATFGDAEELDELIFASLSKRIYCIKNALSITSKITCQGATRGTRNSQSHLLQTSASLEQALMK